MRVIKKSITELKGYSVPQEGAITKLNQNESPYDLPKKLKRTITKRLNQTRWNRYPPLNPLNLKRAICAYVNSRDSGIVIGNGSNEIIEAVFLATCSTGDRVTLVSPGFPIYTRLAKILDLDIVDVPLDKDFQFDVPALIKATKRARLTIFASPNSPTGTILSTEEVEEIARNARGIVAIDEAYHEFHQKTCQRLLDKFNKLVIIRTLSKAIGLAGVRLGYLIAQPNLAREIEKAKLPFSINVFQQIAGDTVVNNLNYVDRIVDSIIRERERIFLQLKEIPGIKPIPSHANFILFESIRLPAKLIFETLYKQGVLVRCFEAQRLENTLRVTIGTPSENRKFIDTLREIIMGKKESIK